MFGCVSCRSKIQSNVATSTVRDKVNVYVSLCIETVVIFCALKALHALMKKPVVLLIIRVVLLEVHIRSIIVIGTILQGKRSTFNIMLKRGYCSY